MIKQIGKPHCYMAKLILETEGEEERRSRKAKYGVQLVIISDYH